MRAGGSVSGSKAFRGCSWVEIVYEHHFASIINPLAVTGTMLMCGPLAAAGTQGGAGATREAGGLRAERNRDHPARRYGDRQVPATVGLLKRKKEALECGSLLPPWFGEACFALRRGSIPDGVGLVGAGNVVDAEMVRLPERRPDRHQQEAPRNPKNRAAASRGTTRCASRFIGEAPPKERPFETLV